MDFDAVTTWVRELPVPGVSVAGLPAEFTMLGIAIVLGLVNLLVAARIANGQRGLKWNLGARDGETPPVSVLAGRLDRAYRNFMETFPFFVAALLAAHAAGRFGWLTLVGSQLYVLARIIYLPLYAMGIPVLRTLVWLVSLIGIVLVIVALFTMPVSVDVVPPTSG